MRQGDIIIHHHHFDLAAQSARAFGRQAEIQPVSGIILHDQQTARVPGHRKQPRATDIDTTRPVSAVLHDRTDGVYLLPASTQFETRGSVTASNRSIQWRDQIMEPLFESKPDHVIIAKFANKFGWADRFFRNIEMEDAETPNIESVTREINSGMWTVGYTGQSPERIKLHMANQHTFYRTTLKAIGGPADGDYYGMPWPCWGTPLMAGPRPRSKPRFVIPR